MCFNIDMELLQEYSEPSLLMTSSLRKKRRKIANMLKFAREKVLATTAIFNIQ